MATKTIIYITNNVLEKKIFKKCQEKLIEVAGDNPIISVSQKPINLGANICVGDIGSSWLSIYRQQLVGLEAAKTEFVAIAEHDVLYSAEHFNFTPQDNKTFFYNDNCWFLQWGGNHPELNGMYSKWSDNRFALSQLICDRELLISSIKERLALIEGGLKIMRKLGEPGAFPPEVVKAAQYAVSGKSYYLKELLEKHVTKFKSKSFRTTIPNLDIRHGDNFTGARRGKNRCFELPYWGRWDSW